MHFDKKLGLALGVLLVGIVGAIFFRNEPNLSQDPPRLTNPSKIDEQIAGRPLTPYLTGIEAEEQPEKPRDEAAPVTPSAPQWDVPSFLAEGNKSDPLAATAPAPPDPIRLDPEIERQMGIPDHNRAWQVQASAPAITPASQKQVFHRVQSGDTLSGLAARYLGDASRYEEIYAINRDVLDSPNTLRPGMMLKIPDKQASVWQPPANENTPGAETAPKKADQSSPSPAAKASPDLGALPAASAASDRPAPRFIPFSRWPLAPGRALQ